MGLAGLTCTSCKKDIDGIVNNIVTRTPAVATPTNDFVKYTIKQGEQYCDKNTITKVSYNELLFLVRFDSSAIYNTISSKNQTDINKLYGFSDNNTHHHQFSARFGWRWSDNALRLFAYNYNNGKNESREIGTVAIGSINRCSIKVTENSYIFMLNDAITTMPRNSTTPKGEGYKLFPYFGGDEMSPHDISIWIKELM